MRQSRRKARETALQAMYGAEIGRVDLSEALDAAVEAASLSPELEAYARRVVAGIDEHWRSLDARIAPLVREYDYERLATIDKNVMRIAAYELYYEPAIPPAVSINEAIEIAKKYSTAESGRFVNGVLGRLLAETPKANWDPASAPREEEEEFVREPEPEVEEEVVEAGSERAKEVARVAGWKLKADD